MAAFEYKALDARGKRKKGVLEGDSARQVRARLKEQGLVPLEVNTTQAQQRAKAQNQGRSLTWRRRLPAVDLMLITRQLATLVQAGMPLEQCLKAVAEQSEKVHVHHMLLAVRSKVLEGYTLAESLSEYPYSFDDLFRAMVAAGEKSGHLASVLERLADYAEHRQKMRSKLQLALIYPVILVVFAIGIVAFLLSVVVPPIVEQFVQMGQTLPQSTQFLLNASHFVHRWGIFMLVGVLILITLGRGLLRKPKIRLKWDYHLMTLPLIGKIARGLNTARFARTLSICTSSAIPILEGMRVAVDVVSNRYVKQQVLQASEQVREGSSLRRALAETQLFPPMMLHMIASGEQSGELESMLTRAADHQDMQFESTMNMALSIFTPALIALMAGMVLFIVMATLMPILEMNNLLN